ncbi:uncharacterized protein BJ171DRAFT_614990 [Polychytrium aggregatum]|uniref:uncharacterized protein n=1 Tax=Polychytrium aggregatum TaxID=110093 RepID=UPI0022FF1A95|nr:uncharacterized protein BJ171DRAFT_614990 [Polychytrium aggregatum]KAI9205564.1 hypothetical protein BJ171DRAFT_614990 [Polychytrium aggregatum]
MSATTPAPAPATTSATASAQLRELFETFKAAEHKYISTLPADHIHALTGNGQLSIQDMYLYGEIGFLLLGLKPAVLIHFPQLPNFASEYVQAILHPLEARLEAEGLRLFKIEHDLASPESRFQLSWVVINLRHPLGAESLSVFCDRSSESVSESQLAQCLDYPGSLPTDPAKAHDHFVEVGYFDVDPGSGAKRLVSSFGALRPELPKVRQHFEHYKAGARPWMNLTMELA